jgi:hypothetical protein
MLRLFTPSNARPERLYIAEVLFQQFLGLEFNGRSHHGDEVVVTDDSGKRLVLDDTFFSDLDEPLLRQDKVPSLPLGRWGVAESGLEARMGTPDVPVLFGKPLANGRYIALGEKEIRLGIDVLGSAFFMLSRYEEAVSSQRDQYDRFPAAASVAYKAGFLERPIVNEYVEILWQCLKRLWPGLVRSERRFRVFLSHDVDQPLLLSNRTLLQVARTIAGDAIKRRSPLAAMKRPAQWAASRFLGPDYDPGYTFDYIMKSAEKHGLRSAFYFIPSLKAGPPDYRYGIRDPHISGLMSDIHARGHEIGYHASMETYLDSELIQEEVTLLRDAASQLGASQAAYGGRQHYLRVKVPVTLRYLAAAELAYDTTLGYADQAGFRCGVCWEYPFYDLEARRVLPILERPLIVMECSVIDREYMGLGSGEEAFKVMTRLAQTCRAFNGDFTLLWHNSRLILPAERRLFETVTAHVATN